MQTSSQVARAAYVLLAVAAIGVTGYVTIEGWPFFDALYMTVMTLTIVGYGEVRVLSPLGRAFTIFLMVTGIGAMLFTLTTVMQYVVEGQLGQAVERRRMKDRLATAAPRPRIFLPCKKRTAK